MAKSTVPQDTSHKTLLPRYPENPILNLIDDDAGLSDIADVMHRAACVIEFLHAANSMDDEMMTSNVDFGQFLITEWVANSLRSYGRRIAGGQS